MRPQPEIPSDPTVKGIEAATMTMDQYPAFRAVARFDQLAKEIRLKVSGTPLKQQADLLREAFNDMNILGLEKSNAKWMPRLPECDQARIDLERFVEAVEPLKDLPGLKDILKKVLADPITQDFKPSQAKNAFYELEMASAVKQAGFHVELREPDVVVSGNGLSKSVAIACKYPSSRQQLHKHLSDGYRQIAGKNLEGVVSIGLDLLVGTGLDRDFRRGDAPALESQFRLLVREVNDLAESRAKDYPEERPLDGLMLTVNIVGIGLDGTERLESSALVCLPGNPMWPDLKIIARGINSIWKTPSVLEQIDRMVKRIVKQFHPEKIILFGSLARGDAGPDSDVDLLVVMDFEGSKLDKTVEVRVALGNLPVPTDIILSRPEDFAWRKEIVGTIEYPATREGKVLYARS
jgi:predicted nucleotidyltransferase